MQLRTLPDSYAVVRLHPGAELPEWVDKGPFRSVTRTDHEVSVVCRDHDVPEGESVDRGWTVLEVMGPLDFSLTGVIAALVAPLAKAEIPIFVISTFESDYVLVRSSDLARAADALEGAGHVFAACFPADLLTPLGAYLRLREGARGAFLLESVERGRLGRHSFAGAGTRLVSFEEAEQLGEPVVGYLGYDAVARFEPTVRLPADGPETPESLFLVPDVLVRFDHARGVAELLKGDAGLLAGPEPEVPVGTGRRGPLEREPSREEHIRRVERAQEHIREGDVFQVVISQRATRPTSASAVELYRALRRVNPSPYLFLLELDDLALVGSSPETVVKCSGTRAELNPIAGTIRPGEGDAAALLASEKDRAEHTMLVDLGRNDLSRVCLPGSVRVERFMEPERYSHVTHLVSEVSGGLQDGVTPFELLRACFPAGTVSGAPKVRAMQIVSECEGYRRGIYAGAVGYCLPAERELDTCIAIRTLWLRDGVAHLQAGGGIVADSDPAAEHEECLAKLQALETAIDLAESEQ